MPTPALPDTIASPGGSLDDISCQRPAECLAFGSRGALTFAMSLSDGKWTEMASASPSFPALYTTFHLACAGAPAWCMAAGADISGNAKPLFLESSSSAWALLPTASPALDLSGEILGISCTSRAFCLAVGWRSKKGDSPGSPLVERFDGSSWSLAPAPQGGEAG